MRHVARWALRGTGVLILVVLAVGIWKREEIVRLMAVNTLFEPEYIVENFSNMEAAFLTTPVPRGSDAVSVLPVGPALDLPEGTEAWIAERQVTALLVLHRGEIVHESYHLGTRAQDRRISWSLAKSWLSLLLGTVLEDGSLPSLDVAVTDYVPDLKGSAYDGARLRDVVQMMSGITFDEDYLEYDSDINRMGREIALGGTLDGFAAALTERDNPPGHRWKYTSIDTHVLGQVIRGATGRTIPDLLSERLVTPMGLDREPYYLVDGDAVAFVLGGLNMTTRDYARMGLLVDQDGMWQGRPLVSRDWIDASTSPSAPTPSGRMGYGYQWWIPVGAQPGEVTARGIYGQYVWIDRRRDVVVVVNAADRKFREPGVDEANIARFRQIADLLASRP